MVGVPGKHGGCATCRRRKKGCDKKAPFCSQCVQAGIVCEGYARHHSVWINSIDGENHKYAKGSPSSLAHKRKGGGGPAITLHESLSRAAREERYVGLYLAAFLPNGRLFSRHASQISTAGWLRHHDELCRLEKTLRFITLAHGLSMLATRDTNGQLKVKGMQAYRMALSEMRMAVQDPKRSTGDGLLAAVRMCRFYEILYGAEAGGQNQSTPNSQIKGYYAHTDGEMALFMNRGCYAKWSDAGRSLLASGRIVSYISGVGRRQRSPFSDIGWVTAPWKNTTKTPLEELTDIMVQMPGLLEELDAIRETPIDKRRSKAWNDLIDRCSSIEEALVSWRKTMGNDIKIYDYTYSGDPLPIPQVDRDFALLTMTLFYWSCSILLYTTIHMAVTEAGQLATHHHSPVPFSPQGCPNYHDERNPTLHAHRIIHALPLSYEPHAGGFGQLSSTFPLGLALRYLVIADFFPHEGGSQDSQYEFLQTTLSQPFMASYSARFVGNLHRVGTSAQSLKDMEGWQGVEMRAKRWWFGPESVARAVLT